MPTIPANEKDFTVAWMNEAIKGTLGDNRITACDARISDIPGQTAEVVMIDVDYAIPDPSLPDRMVAKITSFNPEVLNSVIANYDQYRRETSFYREFPDIGLSVPHCLYEVHNPDTQAFVLLMADLAPAYSPSWAITLDEAETALAALPGMHGKWWNDPILREKDWMVQYDNTQFFNIAFQAAYGAADKIRSSHDDGELTIEIMAKTLENFDSAMNFVASRPYTFVHGDYHAKQMFFPSADGGEFAVIDWQFPFVAQGAWDFARMTGMCLATEDRLPRESALMDNYLEGLNNNGVNDYTRADLELDYRMGLVISQMIMSIAHGDTDVSLFEAECASLGIDWRDAMLIRTQRAMAEWDALGFIENL